MSRTTVNKKYRRHFSAISYIPYYRKVEFHVIFHHHQYIPLKKCIKKCIQFYGATKNISVEIHQKTNRMYKVTNITLQ